MPGNSGVEIPPGAVGEKSCPSVEPTLGNSGLQSLLVIGRFHMELGGIVMGRKQISGQGGDPIQEHRVGVGEGKDDGMFVGKLHRHGRAFGARHPVAAYGRSDVFVEHDVFLPPCEIVGVEGLAVRPLHSCAQVEGKDCRVFVGLPRLGDVGAQRKLRRVPGQALAGQFCGAPAIRDAFEAAAHGPAVVADALHAFEDERVGRQAFVDRRQLAAGNHFCQHWGFIVAARRRGRRRGGLAAGFGGRSRYVLGGRFASAAGTSCHCQAGCS